MKTSRRGRVIAALGCLLLAGGLWASMSSVQSAPSTTASGPKLVLAFFYCWYGPTAFEGEPGRKMSARPSEAYISDHPDVLERQIREADQAGIDGFIHSWTGLHTESADNFEKLLAAVNRYNAANGRNFHVTVYFEVDSVAQRGDVGEQLRILLDQYSGNAAFLRWNSKMVLFFWSPDTLGGPNAWANLRRQVDPNHGQLWSVDTTNAAYLDTFDTVHLFSGGKWQATNNFPTINAQWRRNVDTYNAQHPGADRMWTAGVIPGWDELLLNRQPPDVPFVDRRSGATYEASWRSALASNSTPEWVTITSWNEWFEGTQIEGSAAYGNLYLDLTRKWTSQFKGVVVPVPTATPNTPPPATAITGTCTTMNGHQMCGRFRAYWEGHGGLAQQGLPLTDEAMEPSLTDSGKSYLTQHFERAVFEYHPENANTPYEVQLTLLGNLRYQCKYSNNAPGQHVNSNNGRYFAETRHTVGGTFRAYWESHGGLAQQGYPISEEFSEASDQDAGKTYTVQYFERAVFEYHPENAGTPYEVLLAQLGTYQQQGKLCRGTAPIPTPPPPPPPPPLGVRFFLSASQGCQANAQPGFHYPQMVYAQVALDSAPAGTTVEVRWRGGANNYDHPDSQTVPIERKPACIDGFSLEPSRYGIGPGHYQVSLRLNGQDIQTIETDFTQ